MDKTTWKHAKFLRDNTLLNIDRNECCDFQLGLYFEKFIKNIDPDVVIKYPNLRKAYLSLSKFGLDPDKVLLADGAEGAIRAVIERHRHLSTIALPDPTYKGTELLANVYKMTCIKAPYNDDFKFALQLADIAYVASPDNCTGSIISLGQIEAICQQYSVVIIDETYFGLGSQTAIELLEKYNNLYIIRSFSKAYGAAGLRIGMVISTKSNITYLIQDKPCYEINSVACEFLDFIDVQAMQESMERILRGKRLIEEELLRLGYAVKKTYANFVLVEHDPDLCKILTKFARVRQQDIGSKNYIRITAVDDQTAEKLINDRVFERPQT